jgi:imidazolonepropionase-like amidohydrolase
VADAPTRRVFVGGRVFDGTGSPAASADIAVENGRIVGVGLGLDGDEVLDVSGKTLLPGLFDCHTHLIISNVDLWKHVQAPFSYRFFEAVRNLEATLRAGITTVRDAGGADLGLKRAVEDGLVAGPRMQISLTMLSQTGGHSDGWMPSGFRARLFLEYPGCPSPIVDGAEEMRRKVRELVRAGADVIKVATSGGVLSPHGRPRDAHFAMDELDALVTEARAAGLAVMAHAQSAGGVRNAVRAGIRSIEHGVYLDDEAIALMLENGTWLVPTLMAPHGVLDAAAAGSGISDASLAKAREVVEAHHESFSRAVRAGVKVAMGTDSGVTPHGENLRELQLLVEAGMRPEEALVAATSAAAELMGLENELGTLAPGKRADIVIVEGDPFDFATLADRVLTVHKDGNKVVDRDSLPFPAA